MGLVFQYGSNASRERLNSPDRLDGAAKPISLAVTEQDDFDLAFTYNSKGNRCAVADLIHGRQRIYGALYEIPDERIYRNRKTGGRRTLDEIEGEGNAYERTTIKLRRTDSGEIVDAITYLVIDRKTDIATAPHYVAHIIRGLQEFGAPPDYIDYVKMRAALSNPAAKADFLIL